MAEELKLTREELNEQIAEGVRLAMEQQKHKDEEEQDEEIVPEARVLLYKGNVVHSVKDRREEDNAKGKAETKMTLAVYVDGKLKEIRGFKSELSRDCSTVKLPYQVNTEFKDVKSEKVMVRPTSVDNGVGYALQHSVGGQMTPMTLKVTKAVLKKGATAKYTVEVDGKEYEVNQLNVSI
jgi:hypothetical protein